MWGNSFSTVGDTFSTVEVVQYIGEITSVHEGDNISTVGDNISTVEGIQYSGDTFSTVGDTFSTVGDNISAVEVAQYNGDKAFKYYEFSKNLEIFSRPYFASKSDRPYHRPQLLTTADMVKDLGYKIIVLLDKILL